MSNYIPHYTKKKQILSRKEEALRRLISSDAPREKLFRAGGDVRDARIRVLRAQRATIVPKDDAQEAYETIDSRIRKLEETSTVAVLLEFGCMIENNQGE